jgi:hypothetical protein
MMTPPPNSSFPFTYYEDIYLVSDTSEQILIENASAAILLEEGLDKSDVLAESISSVMGSPPKSHHRSDHSLAVASHYPSPTPEKESPSTTASSRQSRRLSLQVSNDLHRQLKIIALEDEETMNSLIVGVLRKYLQDRNEALKRQQRLSRH